ncbi:MAG: peptide chain release factor 1, partial [Actinomycetota bacterium]
MLDSLAGLRAEHASLQEQLSDSAIHTNPALAKKLNRRYAELSAIMAAESNLLKLTDDLAAAKELAKEDEAFAEELPSLEQQLKDAGEKLRRLLIPRDPDDGRDVIMEVKAGEGGAESALFAGDLLRMYIQYANSKGWKTEILDRTESDLGGIKDVQVAIKSNA